MRVTKMQTRVQGKIRYVNGELSVSDGERGRGGGGGSYFAEKAKGLGEFCRSFFCANLGLRRLVVIG
jgi:hypothetical protein